MSSYFDLQLFSFNATSLVQWLIIAILLLNVQSVPFLWHLRVFAHVIVIRIRMIPVMFYHPWRRDWVAKISPIGQSPFETTVAYKDRVWFDDLDYNIHLSNSSYAKILDIARMRAMLTWFPHILESGARLGLGASHFHFLKEIPLGSEYEIRLNIVGWEDKWTHIVAQFVTYPKGKRASKAKVAEAVEQKESSSSRPTLVRGSTSATLVNEDFDDDDTSIPNQLGLENMNFSTSVEFTRLSSSSDMLRSASSESDDDRTVFSPTASERSRSASATSATSSSSSPHHDAKQLLTAASDKLARSINATADAKARVANNSNNTAASATTTSVNPLPPLPEGAVLHCMHVSTYCFKLGRITIPPRVALTASGFGNVERWARIQEIRHSEAERRREAASTPPVQHTPPANAFSFHEEGTVPEKSQSSSSSSYTSRHHHRASSSSSSTAPSSKRQAAGADDHAKVPRKGQMGGLREILVGGWRRYEKEGLWNLDEFETRRRAGVEKFAPLRHSLIDLTS